MASSNIKLFDENKGNMLSDSEFNISNQRMNGLQTGVASSQLQNKAMYQASLVAYAIAQIMMQNGLNANDTDAVSAFVANLSGTMLQKVYDLATTAEAQAGVATGKWMSPALVKTAVDKILTDKNYLPKSGGTMTGNLILNANPTANLGAATKQYVDSAKNACLLKSGGTMTGNLVLNANPTADLGAATKQYVDNKVGTVTPVFGDLAKDGWFKLGDFTVSGNSFVFYNLFDAIVDKYAKMSMIAVRIKDSTWKTSGSSLQSVGIYSNSSSEGFFIANIAAGQTLKIDVTSIFTINRRVKRADYEQIALSALGKLYYYDNSGGSYRNMTIKATSSNLVPTSIGTAEIWYK